MLQRSSARAALSREDGLGTVLFQTLNKVKIGEEAAVAVCVGHAVGSGKNRANVFHACGVGGHEWLQQGSTPAGDFQRVNLGRQLTAAADVYQPTFSPPGDGHFPRTRTGN